jgi:radical SAM-linked protein
MFRQRLRVFFTKEGALRFISHHDLMRLLERALRRTGLPLKLSEGFNPRPQLSFPVALALGVETQAEVFEVDLTEWVSPGRAKRVLGSELPEGIGIREVQSVAYGEKAEVVSTEFAVRLSSVPEDFNDKLAAFMASAEAVVERKRKSGGRNINAREYVRYAHLDGNTLRIGLGVSNAGTVRPEEVVDAIVRGGSEALAPLHVTRTQLNLAPTPQSQGSSNVKTDVGQHE